MSRRGRLWWVARLGADDQGTVLMLMPAAVWCCSSSARSRSTTRISISPSAICKPPRSRPRTMPITFGIDQAAVRRGDGVRLDQRSCPRRRSRCRSPLTVRGSISWRPPDVEAIGATQVRVTVDGSGRLRLRRCRPGGGAVEPGPCIGLGHRRWLTILIDQFSTTFNSFSYTSMRERESHHRSRGGRAAACLQASHRTRRRRATAPRGLGPGPGAASRASWS